MRLTLSWPVWRMNWPDDHRELSEEEEGVTSGGRLHYAQGHQAHRHTTTQNYCYFTKLQGPDTCIIVAEQTVIDRGHLLLLVGQEHLIIINYVLTSMN